MSDGDEIRGPHSESGSDVSGVRGVKRGRKTTSARTVLPDGHTRSSSRERHAVIVVFSSDHEVLNLAIEAAGANWDVNHSADVSRAHEILSRLKVRLVVIDDDKIEPAMRGWLLEQVRKHAPSALVIYIAAEHDLEGERRARAHPVQFYTARPLDADRVRRVLESFVRAAR